MDAQKFSEAVRDGVCEVDFICGEAKMLRQELGFPNVCMMHYLYIREHRNVICPGEQLVGHLILQKIKNILKTCLLQ